MGTVTLDILKNYIQSQGGVVSSSQIVKEFRPFLKDPVNKAHNKELFKSYLSTLTDYRQDSSERLLELKKAYRDNTVPQSPRSKENHPRNEAGKPVFKDQLQPMREAQRSARLEQDPLQSPYSSPKSNGSELRRDPSRDFLRRDPSRDQLRRDPSRDNLRRDSSRDNVRRDPSRDNIRRDVLTRDRSQDKVNREYSKEDQERQLFRDSNNRGSRSRNLDRSPHRSASRNSNHEKSPRMSSRKTAEERRSPALRRQNPPKTNEETDAGQDNAVITPTRVESPAIRKASINAINMFNRTAQQKKPSSPSPAVKSPTVPEPVVEEEGEEEEDDKAPKSVFAEKADTFYPNAHEDLREEMESGCSNVPLEQGEKEWIVKSALGDCDTICRLLLTDKNLVYYKDFISGYTGLHWSCKLGRIDMAKILLEAGSEVNTKSSSGHTPLHLAAQTGKTELVELILRYGADKDIRDHKGKKAGFYLPHTASEPLKNLLIVPDTRLNNHTNPALRKLSKNQSLGCDLSENTPKRAQTLNQAWKKYKHSFVTKKKKDSGKIDSNKRDTLGPRGDSKENHKYSKSQTLPVNKTAIYNF